MKDFLSLAKERYSCRSFDKKKKVPAELMEQIVEAGRLAPSAMNYQPVKVLIVRSEEKIEALQAVSPCIYGAPQAFVILYDKEKAAHGMVRDGYDFGETDAAIAMTQMILEAADLGLASCWVGKFTESEVREALGLPESISVLGLLPVGYPGLLGIPSPRHGSRKSRAEFAEEI